MQAPPQARVCVRVGWMGFRDRMTWISAILAKLLEAGRSLSYVRYDVVNHRLCSAVNEAGSRRSYAYSILRCSVMGDRAFTSSGKVGRLAGAGRAWFVQEGEPLKKA
jgi:hypothetical protein